MNPRPSPGDAARLKGITAVHCFNGTRVTPEEYQKIIGGPIAIAHDLIEEARKRIDSVPAKLNVGALEASA